MSQQAGVDVKAGISVVVPTFGRDHVLVDTVQALLALPLPPAEIILADQTRIHDEVVERRLAAWCEAGYIEWLRLSEASIPHAMNKGLLSAKSQVVLFLDDDIAPDEKLVEAHARAHGATPGQIIAGRVLQPWHNGEPDPAEKQPFGFNSLESREVGEFMGGNFSLRREDALAVGGFDENFVRVAYRFEAEFSHRWRQSGRRIRYEPTALIHHLKSASGGTRTFGEHLTTAKPDHSVGAYYYFFRTQPLNKGILAAANRLLHSVKTKHHLRQPWWMPFTLLAELGGLAWAVLLALRSPKYITLPPGVGSAYQELTAGIYLERKNYCSGSKKDRK